MRSSQKTSIMHTGHLGAVILLGYGLLGLVSADNLLLAASGTESKLEKPSRDVVKDVPDKDTLDKLGNFHCNSHTYNTPDTPPQPFLPPPPVTCETVTQKDLDLCNLDGDFAIIRDPANCHIGLACNPQKKHFAYCFHGQVWCSLVCDCIDPIPECPDCPGHPQ